MAETTDTVYGFSAERLDGGAASLSSYRGKVLLIVNTASQCGFTPQYAGLEALYRTYNERGLEVLGFPCNQFGAQEPGSAAEIGAFCEQNYGVSFPMFAKIDVNGDQAHPLYRFLKKQKPGLLDRWAAERSSGTSRNSSSIAAGTWWRGTPRLPGRRVWQRTLKTCWKANRRGKWCAKAFR